jgi:glycosyltransferase involved in cell wall biosynthesis
LSFPSFNQSLKIQLSDLANTNNNVFISICIPVYKRTEFLNRLLGSIEIQIYRNFEVIISDDSPDETVGLFCKNYSGNFNITYFKNTNSLGTPENWNEAIRHAKGDWIKLMHDDDWFASPSSLSEFVTAIENHSSAEFLFSAYSNYYFDESRYKEFHVSKWWMKELLKNPSVLFSRNVVGAPSVTVCKKSLAIYYDRNLKWLVDIDFYIRVFSKTKPVYIDKVLINIGIGKEQVTQDCFRQRPIEIPENFYLLKKVGMSQLRNILVYDAWWRLMRNLEIKNQDEIFQAGYAGDVHIAIKNMIKFQSIIPSPILRSGIFSKALMFMSYTFNFYKIKK